MYYALRDFLVHLAAVRRTAVLRTAAKQARVRGSVAAKLPAHGLGHLPGELFFLARREAGVERGAEDRAGHAFVDGGRQRPAAFAGVWHSVFLDRLLFLRQFR